MAAIWSWCSTARGVGGRVEVARRVLSERLAANIQVEAKALVLYQGHEAGLAPTKSTMDS